MYTISCLIRPHSYGSVLLDMGHFWVILLQKWPLDDCLLMFIEWPHFLSNHGQCCFGGTLNSCQTAHSSRFTFETLSFCAIDYLWCQGLLCIQLASQTCTLLCNNVDLTLPFSGVHDMFRTQWFCDLAIDYVVHWCVSDNSLWVWGCREYGSM